MVVLDLVMRGIDGWAFRRKQLEDQHIAHIPIIVFTATRDTELIRYALGTKTVLHKPNAVDALLIAVAVACDDDLVG